MFLGTSLGRYNTGKPQGSSHIFGCPPIWTPPVSPLRAASLQSALSALGCVGNEKLFKDAKRENSSGSWG